MSEPVTLVAGGPCSCDPARRIRYVIHAVPGIPRGEISCRDVDDERSERQRPRRHDLPENAEILVRVPLALVSAGKGGRMLNKDSGIRMTLGKEVLS